MPSDVTISQEGYVGRYKKRRSERRAWSLSAHLLVLCLSILVPGIVLGGLALWILFSAERSSTEMRLLQTVEHIAAGIDREIVGMTRVGESLAASPLLQARSFDPFDLQVRQFLGLQGWFVILSDRNGRQLVNTTLPVGSGLPQTDIRRIHEVIETGKPRVSDLFYAAGKIPLVGVRVPVISAGQTAYVLTVAVPTEILTPVLDRNLGELDWTVEVADREGRVIASSHGHAESVGKALPSSALDQLKMDMPIRRGISRGDADVVRIVDRSALAGWIVAATVYSDELAAISRRGWVTFALLATALAALSIGLAYLFARRIAQPIQHLASVPLEGRTERFPETGLAEANSVGAALFESVRQLETSRERYRTLVEAANDIIFTTDLDGSFLTCNAAGCRALGYTRRELLGKRFSGLLSDSDEHTAGELLPGPIGEVLPSAEEHWEKRFEAEVISRSGQKLIWEVSSRLLRDARGVPETVLSIARDITERRKAEEAIRANEERLRLALAGIGAGVWEYDFTTQARTWSPEMLELYGLDDGDGPPTREGLLDLIHPDDRERVRESAEEQMKTGGPFASEFRVRRPDGRLAWISSRGVVELGADGRAARARGIDQDVTATRIAEQHRAELLRTTAQQLNELQALYNSATVGLALVDREFRLQRINKVLAEMTGFSVEEHLGRQAWDLVPAVKSSVEPVLRRVLETGEPMTEVEISGETPAEPGVERTWVQQFYPLKARDGSVVGIGIICEEVTERRRAQLGQTHLAAIVEASTDAIISWSPEGRIRSWNPGAERMFGYTAAEAVGQSVVLLVPQNSGEPPSGVFERVRAGERLQVEALRQRKDGTTIPVSISASPMRDSHGQIVAASVIFRDISEQKRREEHTRFIMRELSHRSKNLLAVIQAMARQTARTSRDLIDFQNRFTARVRGLAQSHDLLVKRDWRGVPVAELVRTHLEPFIDRSEQGLILSGPGLSLRPEAAQNIGLALHELATNASKHGALSRPTGCIDVRWGVEDKDGERRFRMLWRETGGPEVVKPLQRGFGHTVVDAMVGRALEGEAHLDWKREGLVWRLDAAASCIAPETSQPSSEDVLPDGMADELQNLYRKWLALRDRSGGLPQPSEVDVSAQPEADTMFFAAVDPASRPPVVRYLHVGNSLARKFGWPSKARPARRGGEEVLGSLEDCYRYAASSREPCYDWARINLGEGPLQFERLLLPFSENGNTVSHVLGVVAFSNG